MPYARFCDIHVTGNTAYHFTSEIVEYCRYHIQNKNLNAIGRKSLIVVDFVDNWQTAALSLLKQFPSGRIIFYGGASTATKIRDLWNALKPDSHKKIGIDAGSGSIRNVIPKLLPSEKIGNPNNADFKGFVLRPVTGGYSLARSGAENDNPTIAFCNDHNFELLDDGIGYLSISVPIAEIAQAQRNPGIEKMLRWLVGEASKIRFTCHGDGEGNLEMSRIGDHGTVHESTAVQISGLTAG